MKKNPLIVFEGIDGAGKATHVALLEKRLRKAGYTVTVFDFPRYKTSVGKFIRESLDGKHGDFLSVSPYIAAIPYALDRGGAWHQHDFVCVDRLGVRSGHAAGRLSMADQQSVHHCQHCFHCRFGNGVFASLFSFVIAVAERGAAGR